MARPELGEKRRCLSCESKFYDLKKDPVICPSCDAVFELVALEKPIPEVKAKVEKTDKSDDVVVKADPDTISLEDAEEDDGDTVDDDNEIPSDIPDIEVEDDDDDDDGPFLEDDDDDDDDVSDIIHVTKDDKEDT